MKQYKDLNLKAIMDAEGIAFARWTYGKGQCSCCYGPLDMPAAYWRNRKKPCKTTIDGIIGYELDGKPWSRDEMLYILFKNANNGSGIVKRGDVIQDPVCVAYKLADKAQIARVCAMLQEQLGDDYIVIAPPTEFMCIVIRHKEAYVRDQSEQL